MKKFNLLAALLVFEIVSFSQAITRGPDIGEIYFFGFTVSQGDDGIYRSTDSGTTAICMDSTTQNTYSVTAIAADKTKGGLYHINMGGGLYYSGNYGSSNSWEYKYGNISPFITSGENEGYVYKHFASHSENFGSNFYTHNINGFFGIIKYAEIDAGSNKGYCISRKYNILDTIYFFIAYDYFDSLVNVNKLIFDWYDNIELSRGAISGEVFLCNKSINKLLYSSDYGLSWELKNQLTCPNLPIVGITGGRQEGELYLHVVYTQLMGQRRHVYIYHSLDYGETFTVYHPVSIGSEPIYADFITEDTLVEPGDTVHFLNLSNDAETWKWDFNNDGTIDSYEQNPTHTYQDTGYYSVKLSITGAGGIIQDYGIRYDFIHVDDLTNIDFIVRMDDDIIIYPNPLKDHLNISIKSNQGCILNLSIYNSNGEIVRHFSFNKENAQKLFSIPITDLHNGIYFLYVSAPDQSQTKKVIINH